MPQESNWVCTMCKDNIVLCVPGTKAECGIFSEYFDDWEESSAVKKHVIDKSEVSPAYSNIRNKGIVNRLTGQIVKVTEGQVMANLIIKIGDNYISSIMPIEEFVESEKKVGDTVSIAFKASNVKLMKNVWL
ncbi:MAG TPA: hypothetical protein GX404_04835 [Syntrophomonadaceae bacterium]|nr:hypothetical protein [Syntrophomonadaceae bacterium]